MLPPNEASGSLALAADISEEGDWFVGAQRFAASQGRPAWHTRAVYHQRGDFWVVTDELIAFGPQAVEFGWRLAPGLSGAWQGGALQVKNSAGEVLLRMLPLDQKGELAAGLQASMLKGRDEPVVDGWYSNDFNRREATEVWRFRPKFSAPLVLHWVMLPVGRLPDESAALVSIRRLLAGYSFPLRTHASWFRPNAAALANASGPGSKID